VVPGQYRVHPRINGLASADEVRRIVFDARYLGMGLGDVYLEPLLPYLSTRVTGS